MITDPNYSSWYFADSETTKTYEPPFILSSFYPAELKLFTKDVVELVPDQVPKLIHSSIRTQPSLAGVLLLEQNKTYGRNETKKRLLYKCIPDDKHLPTFLVPYEIKLGFTKHMKNKYVTFKFDHWTQQHPHGILVEVLGDVDNLDVFYEYQLYCKSLHVSMTDFTNKTRNMLKQHTNDEYIQLIAANPQYNIQTVCSNTNYIFTIDPPTSTDYDDAFSIMPRGNNYVVSIYIANVYFWLETLDLWKSFSTRVSTIYLPDRKRPMLPTILSDTLCSLQENQSRFAFTLEMVIDGTTFEIVPESMTFRNTLVRVSKNYAYEDVMLLDNPHYQTLFRIASSIDKSVKDSHDMVAFWMILMNRLCGEKMAQDTVGIFRAMSFIKEPMDHLLPLNIVDDSRRVISMWNNTYGQYCLLSETSDTQHQMMKLKSYIHITSPIRRLVDLLNQMIFIDHYKIVTKLSPDATSFLTYWINQLEYINTTMRSIRKVQTDCEVLRKCTSVPEIINSIHQGIIFDKVQKNDGTYSYMVYLEHPKMLMRLNSLMCLDNYSNHTFKLFVFEDENHIRKKIKLEMIA
jgi:exoribonuclease R